MPLTPSQIHAALWAALTLLIWLLLWLLAPVLMPFLLALALAYVLHPAVERLHTALRWPRWLGAGVAITLLMLALLAVLLLIVPIVGKQLPLLREQLPALLDQVNAALLPLAARWGLHWQWDVDLVRQWLGEMVNGHERELLAGLMSSLRLGSNLLLVVLGNALLMPVVAYYLLLDWASLVARLKALVPVRWRANVQSFLDETDAVLGQYMHGQLLVMAVLAVFYTAALALVGVDLALPIGVFTGLAVFVPYLGFGLGLVLALLSSWLQFGTVLGVALVGGVYLVGQLVESMYLTPRLLGQRIGLHPIAVIFALLAFGHLLGFVGVLVALPASAVLLVAVLRAKRGYLNSALYLGPSQHHASAPSAAPKEPS